MNIGQDLTNQIVAAAASSRVRILFWLCPIREHSSGAWEPGEPVPTVEWRRGIGYCLVLGCGRTSADPKTAAADQRTVVDDGRIWWLLGAASWSGVQLYEAATGRAALAAYRRDLYDAERAGGRPVRETRRLLTASDLHVVAGPITTVAAYQFDLARAYADLLERETRCDVSVPFPTTVLVTVDLAERIDPGKAAHLRARVRAAYLPKGN